MKQMTRMLVFVGLLAIFAGSAWAKPDTEEPPGMAAALEACAKNECKGAVDLLLPLADKGDPKALGILGRIYSEGRGVKRDYAKAVEFLTRAAERNEMVSILTLGEMYQNGIGVPKNLEKAYFWYRKAADQNLSEAQFRLGLMYKNGQHVDQDPMPEGMTGGVNTLTVADVLAKDHQAVFGVPEGDNYKILRSSYSFRGNRSLFAPSRKRSRAPLPMPSRLMADCVAPVKRASQGIWLGIRAVIDYYRSKNIDCSSFLKLSLAEEDSAVRFMHPFTKRTDTSMYWEGLLEDMGELIDLGGISLPLPFIHYDDEFASYAICCLEGPVSLAGLLDSIVEEEGIESLGLSDQDIELLNKVGTWELTRHYADTPATDSAPKAVCLRSLENHYEAFFGEVFETYKTTVAKTSLWIAATEPPEVVVTSKEDVEFAIKYIECFDNLMCAIPINYWDDDYSPGKFIGEMCRFYRATTQGVGLAA